jgi:hypothetical protein
MKEVKPKATKQEILQRLRERADKKSSETYKKQHKLALPIEEQPLYLEPKTYKRIPDDIIEEFNAVSVDIFNMLIEKNHNENPHSTVRISMEGLVNYVLRLGIAEALSLVNEHQESKQQEKV